MNKNPEYIRYENLFKDYPDVISLEEFCKMLGGIGLSTAYKLVKENHVKHIFYQEKAYLIPKVWVIDYVVSEHYKKYKKSLKNQV